MPAQKKQRLRRRKGEGTDVLKRQDGRKRIDVSLGYDKNGKRIRRTVYGLTDDEVLKKKNALLAKYGRGEIANPDKITFGECLEMWLLGCKPNLAESTHLQYAHRIRYYVPEQLRKMRLQDVKLAHLRQLETDLANKNLAVQTRGHTFQHIRAAFEDAVSRELIVSNPARGIRVKPTVADTNKRADPVKKALTDAEMDYFLLAAVGDPLYPLFYTMFSLGLRVGEALGLRWRDINFGEKTVNIVQQVKLIGNRREQGELKTNSSKATLYASEDLLEVLKLQEQAQKAQREVLGDGWIEAELVFTTTLGTMLNRHNVNRTIAGIVEKANTEKLGIEVEGVHVALVRHEKVNFTLSSESLAAGLGVTGNTVRAARGKQLKLKEGTHWIPGKKKNSGNPAILWTRDGAMLVAQTLTTPRTGVFTAALEAFELPSKLAVKVRPFTSHACRHTSITAMLRDHVPAEIVAAHARHSKPSVTLDIYRTVFEDEKRSATVSIAERRKKLKDK